MDTVKKTEFIQMVNFTAAEEKSRGGFVEIARLAWMGRGGTDVAGPESKQMCSPKFIVTEPRPLRKILGLAKLSEAELMGLIRKAIPKVGRIMLPDGDCFFVVSLDGNHRVAAARLKGISAIPVEVGFSVPSLRGKEFVVSRGLTYAVEGDVLDTYISKTYLPIETANVLSKRILEFRGADVLVVEKIDAGKV